MTWGPDSNFFIDKEKQYLANTYSPLPVVLSHGRGVWVWDVLGKRYLDMMSAYSAVSCGHGHPKILQTLMEQAQRLCIPSRAFYTDRLGNFIEKLCQLTGLEMAIPQSTGVEAVEAGIKSARIWGYKVKGIAKDKAEIIVAENNFHGRTTTVIGFSSDEVSRDGFGPFAPGFIHVPFGDAEAIEKAITSNTCAVLIEPIQGEAGIIVPPEGYLSKVRKICTDNNVLFILDEIQSGLGRTGKMFAFQHEDAQPDGIMLGKALGGGILPVAAFVSRREVIGNFRPGSHGSTFGGNPLAATVGLKSLEVIENEHLVEKSARNGAYLIEKLRKIEHPGIKEVRGKGLWVGIELDPKVVKGKEIALKCLEKGILAKETHEKTIRLAPPLVITQEEIDWGVEQFEAALREF